MNIYLYNKMMLVRSQHPQTQWQMKQCWLQYIEKKEKKSPCLQLLLKDSKPSKCLQSKKRKKKKTVPQQGGTVP